MHRHHHNAASALTLALLAMLPMLSACSDLMNKIPPGPLGALFDRRPPLVSVRATGPYANPLADPVAPMITQGIADRVVAPTLRLSLKPAARVSLAEASMRAATVATGKAIPWRGGEASGFVVPLRDVYVSENGPVCRDLRQEAQIPGGPEIQQITLCHQDQGDDRHLWMPASID